MREVQKKNTFFFLLPSGSSLDLQVKGTNKWEKYKRKTLFSLEFPNGSTFGLQVKGTNKWEKNQMYWGSPSVSTDLTQKALNTINFSLLFMGYLENYRIFIIPNLGVLYILLNTGTSRNLHTFRLLPVLFRQTPNFLIFNQSPN